MVYKLRRCPHSLKNIWQCSIFDLAQSCGCRPFSEVKKRRPKICHSRGRWKLSQDSQYLSTGKHSLVSENVKKMVYLGVGLKSNGSKRGRKLLDIFFTRFLIFNFLGARRHANPLLGQTIISNRNSEDVVTQLWWIRNIQVIFRFAWHDETKWCMYVFLNISWVCIYFFIYFLSFEPARSFLEIVTQSYS